MRLYDIAACKYNISNKAAQTAQCCVLDAAKMHPPCCCPTGVRHQQYMAASRSYGPKRMGWLGQWTWRPSCPTGPRPGQPSLSCQPRTARPRWSRPGRGLKRRRWSRRWRPRQSSQCRPRAGAWWRCSPGPQQPSPAANMADTRMSTCCHTQHAHSRWWCMVGVQPHAGQPHGTHDRPQ